MKKYMNFQLIFAVLAILTGTTVFSGTIVDQAKAALAQTTSKEIVIKLGDLDDLESIWYQNSSLYSISKETDKPAPLSSKIVYEADYGVGHIVQIKFDTALMPHIHKVILSDDKAEVVLGILEAIYKLSISIRDDRRITPAIGAQKLIETRRDEDKVLQQLGQEFKDNVLCLDKGTVSRYVDEAIAKLKTVEYDDEREKMYDMDWSQVKPKLESFNIGDNEKKYSKEELDLIDLMDPITYWATVQSQKSSKDIKELYEHTDWTEARDVEGRKIELIKKVS